MREDEARTGPVGDPFVVGVIGIEPMAFTV